MAKYDYAILCEKPSQARSYAKALGGNSGTIGFGKLKGSSYVICNAVGHIYNLTNPDSQVSEDLKAKYGYPWEISKLPWNHNDLKWKLKLDSGKKEVANNIKKCFDNADSIIIATDNDSSAEGDLLAAEIIIELGFNKKKHFYRSLHEDETVKKIQLAIDNLKDFGTDVSATDEYCKSNFRRKLDYTLGLQETQLATVLAGNNLLRWGRLKSFILNVCYLQQQLIDNYVEVPFYENRFRDENSVMYTNKNEPRYDAEDKVVSNYHPSDVILDKTEKKHTAPPLFKNLDQIASALASKYSGKQVETTYQKMYEAGYVSYPRTDDKKITDEQWREFERDADKIADVVGVDKSLLTHRTPRKTHIATGMSHGANRPGTNVPSSLSHLETEMGKIAADIYVFIAKETLTIFAEDYEYESQRGHLKDYPDFIGTANVALSDGWRAIFDNGQASDAKKGLGTHAEPFIFRGTNPRPAALTRSWLTQQMEKADVGTGSTRLSTVNELTSETSKNPPLLDRRGKLSLTEWGKLSGVLLQGTKISELDFTKHTYQQMEEVAKDHSKADFYLGQVAKIIENDIKQVSDNASKIKIAEYTGSAAGITIGKCPVCGADVYEKKTKYGKTIWTCENNNQDNPNPCKFVLYDKQKYFNDTLTLSSPKVKKLLEGKNVSFKLTAKSGKKYDWDMALKTNDAGYAQFEKIGFSNDFSKNKKKS